MESQRRRAGRLPSFLIPTDPPARARTCFRYRSVNRTAIASSSEAQMDMNPAGWAEPPPLRPGQSVRRRMIQPAQDDVRQHPEIAVRGKQGFMKKASRARPRNFLADPWVCLAGMRTTSRWDETCGTLRIKTPEIPAIDNLSPAVDRMRELSRMAFLAGGISTISAYIQVPAPNAASG